MQVLQCTTNTAATEILPMLGWPSTGLIHFAVTLLRILTLNGAQLDLLHKAAIALYQHTLTPTNSLTSGMPPLWTQYPNLSNFQHIV